MSIQNRVLTYYKNSAEIQLKTPLSCSTDDNCIIFSISNKENTAFGTLRAIALLEQKGTPSKQEQQNYHQQLTNICNCVMPSLDNLVTPTFMKYHFLSPVKLEQEELQKEVHKTQKLEYILPKTTYQLYEWKEEDTFGADLYICQMEPTTMKQLFDCSEKETQNSTKDSFESPKTELSVDKPLEKKQATGILMKGSNSDTVIFGKEIPKKQIKEIIFLDTLENLPKDAWDVSEQKNKSVMAWIENDVLYIGGDGGVIANTDCSYLFYKYSNVKTINFNNCFDTKNVTNMRYMFSRCSRLTSLDISSFDTKNVTDMTDMFSWCSSLTSLDVSGFDTKNVTDMTNMFSWCGSLTSLDVSSFDTTNVKDMSCMFSRCYRLASLDVSHFDTTNMKDMRYMFLDMGALT